ncbi:MAG TPA: hypothetical protein ENJ44_06810, partial [Oceanospirillales bacterium]|nr:hypothetical protein [Oceanospirillales bacterium]
MKTQLFLIIFITTVNLQSTGISADSLNKFETTSFECDQSTDCSNKAKKFLSLLDLKVGKVYGHKRYASENEANIAAAKAYSKASVNALSEVNWITFKDSTNVRPSYGFTFPAVSNYKFSKSKGAARVFDSFMAQNLSFTPVSLGHSHYDNNECFSSVDLKSFIGKNGNFVLVTKSGNVSYLNKNILANKYNITGKKTFFFLRQLMKFRKYIRKNNLTNELRKIDKNHSIFYKTYVMPTLVYGE